MRDTHSSEYRPSAELSEVEVHKVASTLAEFDYFFHVFLKNVEKCQTVSRVSTGAAEGKLSWLETCSTSL